MNTLLKAIEKLSLEEAIDKVVSEYERYIYDEGSSSLGILYIIATDEQMEQFFKGVVVYFKKLITQFLGTLDKKKVPIIVYTLLSKSELDKKSLAVDCLYLYVNYLKKVYYNN